MSIRLGLEYGRVGLQTIAALCVSNVSASCCSVLALLQETFYTVFKASEEGSRDTETCLHLSHVVFHLCAAIFRVEAAKLSSATAAYLYN